MTILETVNRAADKADLSIKNTTAANAYRLLAWTMVECGNVKLPYSSLTVLSNVMKERTGLATSTGSLRWYRVQLMKDTETVDRMVGLPTAFKTLVREAA